MKQGSKLVVSSGQGTFVCFFVSWKDDNHINAINRFGATCVVSQFDIEEFFV